MAVAGKVTQAQYLEYVDQDLVPDHKGILVTTHRPRVFRMIYHHHASIEADFQIGCDLEYSFSGRTVRVPRDRMSVFWGAAPHRVTQVNGDGRIINVYISLARLIHWGLPERFIEAVVGGAVVIDKTGNDRDASMYCRWSEDFPRADPSWLHLLLGEVEVRFRRMALEGYDILLEGAGTPEVHAGSPAMMQHIGSMLRFIADNFSSNISVADVADHVGLSPSYAMSLFRKAVGVPIKEHITRIRLSHAQMLLATSDVKILNVALDSGFGSVSSFYDAFQLHMNTTPAAFRKEARE